MRKINGMYNKVSNDAFEPEAIIEIDERGNFIIIQKKIWGADVYCIDIRRWVKASRIKNLYVTIPSGENLVPLKGLFLDWDSFKYKIMPVLRKLFPENG